MNKEVLTAIWILLGAILFSVAVVLGVMQFVHSNENKEIEKTFKTANPYPIEPRDLHEDTLNELREGKERKHIKTPAEVKAMIAAKETFYLHVFTPSCTVCTEEYHLYETLKDEKIPYVEVNGLEYAEELDELNIQRSPSVVAYLQGQAAGEISGQLTDEAITNFFTNTKAILLKYSDFE